MRHHIQNSYTETVLKHPLIVCLLLVFVLGFFSAQVKHFKLDASSDSLLLDNDKDLRLFRETSERYAVQEYLFITFTPKEDLFSKNVLAQISRLRTELRQLEPVESLISMLDVPLVRQLDGGISEVADNVKTLESPDVDIEKARQELLNSPIYKELIISEDGRTTALQLNLKTHPELIKLSREKTRLVYKSKQHALTAQELLTLKQIKREYAEKKQETDRINHENIANIRKILIAYHDYGTLHLGGIPMIADDMVSFIKHDLIVFGVAVFLFLVAMLTILFRKPRWVILPLLSCFYAGLLMIGLLALVGWHVTVISSNFILLMLIITLSMNIHLVVRYRQLHHDFPDYSQHELILHTVRKMVWPCFYTALTTIIAFASLVVSGIKPVIDFGWMMTIGLGVTFLISFILFPALLSLLPKSPEASAGRDEFRFTSILATATEKHGNKIIVLTLLLTVVSLFGISRLEVENSFIDYFSDDTEIYQGLSLIDQKLGGTTPLDIILNLEKVGVEKDGEEEDFEDLDALFAGFEEEESDLWLTLERVDKIKQVHDYLDSLPEVGKVLSLASVIRVAEEINGGEFDAFELGIVSKRIPEKLRETMVKPYLSEENNEARINARILDSLKDLHRKALLERIQGDLTNKLGFNEDDIKISGLLVLYNNMLQSLFRSQILTLGVVMAGIALMLFILFRSIPLAIIGIIPNVLAAVIILGLMGLLRISLDMMTITIAAITIGIAVDNSIHYIYRFREEFPHRRDYITTLHYCHAHIGKAVFYTAITIIIGFSILTLSNFIPTVYFGLLTALAMSIALFAALTLLPKLILIWKPFK